MGTRYVVGRSAITIGGRSFAAGEELPAELVASLNLSGLLVTQKVRKVEEAEPALVDGTIDLGGELVPVIAVTKVEQTEDTLRIEGELGLGAADESAPRLEVAEPPPEPASTPAQPARRKRRG